GIQTCFVHTDVETRTNLKVVDPINNTFTDINEPGGQVIEADIRKLESNLLSRIKADDIVVFSGRVANGMDASIVKEWAIQCKQKGARVFVDAEGDTLKLAIEAEPYLIKPNLDELESITGKKLDKREAVILECNRIIECGVSVIVLSLGKEGALFFNEQKRLYIEALDVQVKSTVGAGDSMMAAFAYGVHNNLDFEETARLSIAVSGAKVTCQGTEMPDKEQVNRMYDLLF
ncbi:MAG: 1-phosphofructokinase, partial [Clostridiales bacterium]|nr:1-phosphofructokinase [Clostridiales bacterium]